MPQRPQESARLQAKRKAAAQRQQAGAKPQRKLDPIQAIQSKLAELMKDPDADEGTITLLKDRLKQLQDERDPAGALANKLSERNKMLQKMTGKE